MIRCVILDDEPNAIQIIQEYISKTHFLECVESFREPQIALEFLQSNQIDLLFLDINMPKLSGIELAKKIDNTCSIIFTTAYSEFAVESYELNAIDYLLKPIVFDRFLSATAKVLEKHTQSKMINGNKINEIYLKSGAEIHRVRFEDILFMEKDKHYIIVHLKTKKIVTRMSFSTLKVLIPSDDLIQVHKSFIISMKHFDRIDSNQVWIDKHVIPIGRQYKDVLKTKLNII